MRKHPFLLILFKFENELMIQSLCNRGPIAKKVYFPEHNNILPRRLTFPLTRIRPSVNIILCRDEFLYKPVF